ncbi:hypothetical protein C8J30_1064 [Rhodobacter viridis]|uniref:Uncharacterized protein n=1 Tax=Rhodobacter viridis TaxID=1054202 RepID=A0A318U1G0_9RHOB|nr:hypothetical protein [Rhodobacter viridis]PYF09872.1 hypothetical protein C8J30_1064 [Rhodobacter viridis]
MLDALERHLAQTDPSSVALLLVTQARLLVGKSLVEAPGPPPPPAPILRERADMAAQMRAIEAWYRRNEPTSPIPVLLARARVSLDRDFETLVAELLPNRQK